MQANHDDAALSQPLTNLLNGDAVSGWETGLPAPDAAALEAGRQRLFSLLNELPAIVYLKAPDYSIRFANRQFRERFGEPGIEPCYQTIHNRNTPCTPCATVFVLADKRPVEWEWTYADGRCYQLYDYPFVDVDGTEMVLQLGIDITERKEAEAELERTNRELLALSQTEREQRLFAEGLAHAVLALNRSLDRADVLDRILEQTQRVIPCSAATVMLLEDHKILLARQRGLEPLSESLRRLRSGVPLEDLPLLGTACLECQPLLIQDLAQTPGAYLTPGLKWVRSLAAVPLVQGGDVIGLITLFSNQPDFFGRGSLQRLAAFATHAVLAIQNAQLFEKTQASREQLQSLSRRLVDVQENERRYVARELHDEAGQALTSVRIGLELLQRQADNAQSVRESSADLLQMVEEVMENLHRLAMDLRPASLDHLGLIAALHQYCKTLADQHGIRVAFEAIGIDGRVGPEVETALYRIVQEALTNVVRHARATRADVLLERRGDRIVAIVEDDGQGLDLEAAAGPDHLGLVGIQERAMALGGSLTIEGSPCGGTALFVEVPHAYPGPHRG